MHHFQRDSYPLRPTHRRHEQRFLRAFGCIDLREFAKSLRRTLLKISDQIERKLQRSAESACPHRGVQADWLRAGGWSIPQSVWRRGSRSWYSIPIPFDSWPSRPLSLLPGKSGLDRGARPTAAWNCWTSVLCPILKPSSPDSPRNAVSAQLKTRIRRG